MEDYLSDKVIIETIKAGGQSLDRAVEELYKDVELSKKVHAFVFNKGGNKKDAEDILHEGILNLLMNIRAGKYKHSNSLTAYIISICKNLWYTQYVRRAKLKDIKGKLSQETETNKTPENIFIWKECCQTLSNVLTILGRNCKEILGYWALGYSFKEIGKLTKKTEGAARKSKHSCLKKLAGELKGRPELVKELLASYKDEPWGK